MATELQLQYYYRYCMPSREIIRSCRIFNACNSQHMLSIMMMPLLNKFDLKGLNLALSVAQPVTCRDSYCQTLDIKMAKPDRRISTCRDHEDIHALPA